MGELNKQDIQKELTRKNDICDFFNNIFHGIDKDEFVRIGKFYNKNGTTIPKISYYTNINNIAGNVLENAMNCDTYFNLCSTNGKGKESDMVYRYCICLDWDLKDFIGCTSEQLDAVSKDQHREYKKALLNDITERVKSINLHYHMMIDSGNGFHLYLLINKTNDFEKVELVQKSLCEKLNADDGAIKSTQILRIPYTYNKKNNEWIKLVKIVKDNTTHDRFRRYTIDQLHTKYVLGIERTKRNRDFESVVKTAINTTNMPKCIENILNNGSKEGKRNEDLQRIVITFKRRNMYINEVLDIAYGWNEKNSNPLNENELNYQTKYMYDNLSQCSYDCFDCGYTGECFKSVKSDFEYDDEGLLVCYSETNQKYLKKSKRSNAKMMNGNELLVYSILKLHNDGMGRDEIIKDMTYTKRKEVVNVAMSDKTLTNTLNGLINNGFIEVKTLARNKKIYTLSKISSKAELTYKVSYGATYECVKGNITTEELRLYYYMRFLHHKEQRENPNSPKGNLFQCNQEKLAEDLGVTQGRISQMIQNLLDEKILGLWYRQQSTNNGFDFNIYRLVY